MVEDLVRFINELHGMAVEIALPLAGLAFAAGGLLWMTGSAKYQRIARRCFVSGFIGLVIVILSDGFVTMVSDVLCGGGA